MEGTAYQVLAILEAAEALTGDVATEVVVVGGGTRSSQWLQIKADISGKAHLITEDEEAALRGAALTAAIGSGRLDLDALPGAGRVTGVEPNQERHGQYRRLFERDFLPFQRPLRALGSAPEADLAHA
jgi:sugar (pentulose or hexulose) kinase